MKVWPCLSLSWGTHRRRFPRCASSTESDGVESTGVRTSRSAGGFAFGGRIPTEVKLIGAIAEWGTLMADT